MQDTNANGRCLSSLQIYDATSKPLVNSMTFAFAPIDIGTNWFAAFMFHSYSHTHLWKNHNVFTFFSMFCRIRIRISHHISYARDLSFKWLLHCVELVAVNEPTAWLQVETWPVCQDNGARQGHQAAARSLPTLECPGLKFIKDYMCYGTPVGYNWLMCCPPKSMPTLEYI